MPRLPTPITEAISDLRSYATNPKLADEIQADLEELIAAAIAPPSPVESGPAASPAGEPDEPCPKCGRRLGLWLIENGVSVHQCPAPAPSAEPGSEEGRDAFEPWPDGDGGFLHDAGKPHPCEYACGGREVTADEARALGLTQDSSKEKGNA